MAHRLEHHQNGGGDGQERTQKIAPCLFTGKPGVEEILIGRAY